jgi:phosphate transport system substrate-binding protein
VDQLVAPGEVREAASAWIERVRSWSALTQEATKEMITEVIRDGAVDEATRRRWEEMSSGSGEANEGVAAFVARLPNSIGYVEFAYVKQNRMVFAQMRNQAGNFVPPSDAGFKAASLGADWSRSFYQVLTEQPGAESWPMTGATFIMMHARQDKPAQAAASLRFFDWAFANGDEMAAALEFVPLEPAVKDLVRREWAKIRDGGGTAVAFR